MPMIALAAYSVYQGVQAGKQAKASAGAANAALQQEQGVGAEEQKYYRDKYGPMNQMLVDYAMGNKASPYLAAAKGKVEQGYQQGVTQLQEMSGRAGLEQSGIGAGQKIGLNMERAKAEAGLNLQDQAQRYGIAQHLSTMETNEQTGAKMAAGALGSQAAYAQQNAASASQAAGAAFGSAATALGGAIQGGEFGYGGSGGDTGPTAVTNVDRSGNPGSDMSPIGQRAPVDYGMFTPGTVPEQQFLSPNSMGQNQYRLK